MTPADILCTNYHSLADWMKKETAAEAAADASTSSAVQPMETESSGSPAQQAEQAQAEGSPGAEAAAMSPLGDVQSKVLASVMDDYLLNTRPEVRSPDNQSTGA